MGTERRPLHIAVTLGLTTGVYAASLAAVTAFQADHDRAAAAGRAPVVAAMGSLGDANDRLTRGIEASAAGYVSAADGYRALSDRLTGLEAHLAELGGAVGEISGGLAALPSRIALPKIGRTVARTSAPSTQATTGASGKP